MDRFDLQKLRDLPIEGVAERLGIQVTRHKCLCPFHEDHHPSMSLKETRYRCFVCGAHGDPISLAQKVLNKDFLEACRWLADEHNVIITEYKPQPSAISHQTSFDASRYARFFERPWLSPEARRFLFEERRLDPRVVRWCRLTSWKDKHGIPWLQIPYYSREGKLVGVQNRRLTPNPSPVREGRSNGGDNLLPQLGEVGRGLPRFRFPQGSQCGIYNLPVLNLLKPGEELYITEGCSDCWAMLSAGHKAIAIPSATLLSKKDKEILSSSLTGEDRGGAVSMFPDNDVPGERLFLQLKEVLPNLVRHQLPQGCKDYSDFYLQKKSLVKS